MVPHKRHRQNFPWAVDSAEAAGIAGAAGTAAVVETVEVAGSQTEGSDWDESDGGISDRSALRIDPHRLLPGSWRVLESLVWKTAYQLSD